MIQNFFLVSWVVIAACVTLKYNGKNVCKREIAYTTHAVVSSTKLITTYYTACCRKVFAKCVEYCVKARQVQQKITQVKVVAKLRREYFCCNGWSNVNEKNIKLTECIYAVCNTKCMRGTCVSPNKCQITYDADIGFEKAVLNQKSCGGDIINIEGAVSLLGVSNVRDDVAQSCQWTVRIPYDQKTKFSFTSFHFDVGTRCADSIITISTSKMEYLFCSERLPKKTEKLEYYEKNFVINVAKRNWNIGEGFTLKFKDAYVY